MPLANLMYGLLVNDRKFFLWRYQSDFLFSQETADTFYTIIVFPATVLLFLSNDPDGKIGKFIHTIKYVTIYCAVEWIGLKFGALTHAHGWNMLWSIFFNIVTFNVLRVHHKNPLIAYVFSVVFIIILLNYFNVPLTDPE
jgi:hypothetical protein